MSLPVPAVIHKAMRSHDGVAVERLEHIKELQQTPGGRLHLKALRMANRHPLMPLRDGSLRLMRGVITAVRASSVKPYFLGRPVLIRSTRPTALMNSASSSFASIARPARNNSLFLTSTPAVRALCLSVAKSS